MADLLPQDPDELFDVVDERGRPTGVVKRRADVHRDGDWHRAVHIWIVGQAGQVGRNDGEPFILFQRRGAGKDTWPDKLDATAAGHLRAGESVTDALREVDEELGITPDVRGLRHIGTRYSVSKIMPDLLDREVQEVFLLRDDRPLRDYSQRSPRVSGLARFSLDPLLALFNGDRERAPAMVLDAATGRVSPVDIPLADFIPVSDAYFTRVAGAARAALHGDQDVSLEPGAFVW